MIKLVKKVSNLTVIIILLLTPFVFYQPVYAQDLFLRSVTVSSSVPAAQISETFTFSLPTTNSIGSIAFEHCLSPLPADPCVPPSGYSSNSATLVSQSNNIGFTINVGNSTINKPVISRAPASGNLGTTSYSFNGVINGNAPGQTIYVRIATYASIDGTGPVTDGGTVAFAILGGFSIGAYVPPFLIFCVGVTVALNCSNFTGTLLAFGELLPTQTKTATSQFSGATNDPGGYAVYLNGQTMTAGNLSVPAVLSSGSIVGSSQFGINLRANTNPVVGANSSGIGTAVITAGYGTANIFRFVNGEQLATSPTSTDYNVQTISYIVNVSKGQQPGYYATTMTYVAVAAF